MSHACCVTAYLKMLLFVIAGRINPYSAGTDFSRQNLTSDVYSLWHNYLDRIGSELTEKSTKSMRYR